MIGHLVSIWQPLIGRVRAVLGKAILEAGMAFGRRAGAVVASLRCVRLAATLVVQYFRGVRHKRHWNQKDALGPAWHAE
jgi:hypothetical protein